MKKNILIFAPYGSWRVHHQVDAIIGKALQLRENCQVVAMVCDGIFMNCPINKGNKSCQNCINSSNKLFDYFNISKIQLSSLLNKKMTDMCFKWAKEMPVNNLSNAIFEEMKIGKWVSAGMNSYFMSETIDFNDINAVNMYRSFIYNGALLKCAYDRMLKVFYPDHVFCYGGFHAFYRVILELSINKSIPVLSHERGFLGNSFTFVNSESMHSYKGRVAHWEHWKDIPLLKKECLQLKEYIYNREYLKDSSIDHDYTFTSEIENIRNQLRIPADANIVTVFTTTDWELGISEIDLPTKFSSQIEWLKHIITQFDLDNTYLVIRHHPAQYSLTNIGKIFLQNLIKLQFELPPNLKIRNVMPYEKVTSYPLIWLSKAAIIMRSTIGVEGILRGLGTASELKGYKSITGIYDIEGDDYNSVFKKMISNTQHFGIENLRQAFRSSYYLFYRLSYQFKSFGIKDRYKANICLKSFDELHEGVDPVLDRICNHILKNDPLYPLPIEHKNRSLEDETDFLLKELEFIKNKRNNTIKYSLENSIVNEPQISIIKIATTEKKSPFFTTSIKISRHRAIEVRDFIYHSEMNIEQVLSLLKKQICEIQSHYVYCVRDNTFFDESFLAFSVDCLSDNSNYDGIFSGAWISDEKMNLIGEIFTERNPELKDKCPALSYIIKPFQIFSFFVWKKESLNQFISQFQSDFSIDNKFTSTFFNIAFPPKPFYNFYKLQSPMITLFPEVKAK